MGINEMFFLVEAAALFAIGLMAAQEKLPLIATVFFWLSGFCLLNCSR